MLRRRRTNWPAKQKEEWLTSFNYYTADVVSIHEVYPGHYVQFLRLNASPANKVEKIFGSYGFIEGWAHYCEKMMLDEGFGGGASDKADRGGDQTRCQMSHGPGRRSASPVMPAVRLSEDAHAENDRGRSDQVLSGELLLRRKTGALRSDARNVRSRLPQLHARQTANSKTARRLQSAGRRQAFRLQKFHNQMLDHGMPPIRLLREIMLKDKAKWDEVL